MVINDFNTFALVDNVFSAKLNESLFSMVDIVRNILRQKYIREEEISTMEKEGFVSSILDNILYSSGIKLSCATNNSSEIDGFCYYMMLSSPLLTTPENYYYFSRFLFSGWRNFKEYFVSLLSCVPVFTIGFLPNEIPNIVCTNAAELLYMYYHDEHNVMDMGFYSWSI